MRSNKHVLVVVLCLSLVVTLGSLFAHHHDSSISLIMYNDGVTLGLSENPDDLRSYGMDVIYTHFEGWVGKGELSGLTYRLDPSGGTRYDEISFLGGREVSLPISRGDIRIHSHVSLLAGITLAGNFGFHSAQNFVHDTLDIPLVHFGYDEDTIKVYPLLDLIQALDVRQDTPWYSSSEVIVRASVEERLSIGYEQRLAASLLVGHRTEGLSEFFLGLGYTWNEPLDQWQTHKAVSNKESGLTATAKGHMGMFAASYTWYLQTKQGYGGLGLDIGINGHEKWERNDIILSIGPFFGGGMIATSLRYSLYKELGFTIHNYFKMIPIDTEGVRKRENISSWLLGIDYEIPQLRTSYLHTFASTALGFKRYLVTEVEETERNTTLDEVRFSSMISIGVRFLSSGQLQYGGVGYGLEVQGGLILSDNSNLPSLLEFTEIAQLFVMARITMGSRL
ncbi:MAG: hypothetical protein WCY81_05945 [Sphaerochaetaceae bacterium]|jgi:hypothetical protein